MRSISIHKIALVGLAAILLIPLAFGETPVDTSKNLDFSALNFVLQDLLTYSGDDSPVLIKDSPPNELIFAPNAATWPQTVDAVLYRQEEKPWARLTAAQQILVQEAASNLVMRANSTNSFASFKPVDSRIRLFTDETTPDVFGRPIRAWPPGYSDDNSIAVVRLSIPWSIHHADGTYILARSDTGWTILLRQFVYYV